MSNGPYQEPELLQSLLDAIPSFVFAMDGDVRILTYNVAAAALLGPNPTAALHRRGGDVLHCLHATETPEGCGHAPACADCAIRQSVGKAIAGTQVVRARARLDLVADGRTTPFYALVTASPFDYRGNRVVLVIIEDLSQMVELQRLIPICAKCRKIRSDVDYWTRMEAYFKEHLDVDFTHGYCPDCFQAEMERVRGRE